MLESATLIFPTILLQRFLLSSFLSFFFPLQRILFGKASKAKGVTDGERLRRRTGKADTRILLCFEDIEQADQETGMTLDLDGRKQRGALA